MNRFGNILERPVFVELLSGKTTSHGPLFLSFPCTCLPSLPLCRGRLHFSNDLGSEGRINGGKHDLSRGEVLSNQDLKQRLLVGFHRPARLPTQRDTNILAMDSEVFRMTYHLSPCLLRGSRSHPTSVSCPLTGARATNHDRLPDPAGTPLGSQSSVGDR